MEVLMRENIIDGNEILTKEEAIERVAKLLEKSGYVTQYYLEAMLKKEEIFNTCIGFGLAIPHGIEDMRSEILKTGIVVIKTPKGLDWGEGNTAKLIIGIAGTGDEHMQVISNIAMHCTSEEAVEQLSQKDSEELYRLFSQIEI